MPRSNYRNNRKEDITQVKAPIYNVSTVTNENECKDPLLIKDKDGYKAKEKQHPKVYTILTPKTTPKLNSLAIHFN